jgi:hypothetical protein
VPRRSREEQEAIYADVQRTIVRWMGSING